jgi:hypothetical protein
MALRRGVGEAVRVDADFALVHGATVVVEQVLDGVFDGQDMALAVVRPVVDHRGQRGALARTRSADNQQQTAPQQGQVLHDGRQTEGFEVRDGGVDQAGHHRGLAALAIDADAEAADVRRGVGEVGLQLPLEVGYLLGAHDRVGQRLCLSRLQGRDGQRPGLPLDLDVRRSANGQKQIRCIGLDHLAQQSMQRVLVHTKTPFSRPASCAMQPTLSAC